MSREKINRDLISIIKSIYVEIGDSYSGNIQFKDLSKNLPFGHSTLTKKLNELKSLNLISYEKEVGSYKSEVVIHKRTLTKYNINLVDLKSCTIMSHHVPSHSAPPPTKPITISNKDILHATKILKVLQPLEGGSKGGEGPVDKSVDKFVIYFYQSTPCIHAYISFEKLRVELVKEVKEVKGSELDLYQLQKNLESAVWDHEHGQINPRLKTPPFNYLFSLLSPENHHQPSKLYVERQKRLDLYIDKGCPTIGYKY